MKAKKDKAVSSVEETLFAGNVTQAVSATQMRRGYERAKERAGLALGRWRPRTPLPPDVPANLVPGCTLQAVIGTGGMGTVYLAKQDALNRQVAVKVLNMKLSSDSQFMSRLRQEAQIMATLTHPNLVGCHDIIVSKNVACLLMEYIPGHLNGRNIVRLLGPMPERYVVMVMNAVAKGLAYAYEKGFTHRDVKPDNILFAFAGNRAPESYHELFESPDARIALCDFGIASTTGGFDEIEMDDAAGSEEASMEDTNAVMGSPLYMAPEQAVLPENVDCRSDIYALGATAYFLLTGHPPFPGKNMDEILGLKAECDMPSPVSADPSTSFDSELVRTVTRMGACHQEDRFQNYSSLLEKLEALEAPYASNLTPRILLYRYKRPLRIVYAVVAAIGFIVTAALYGYAWWMEHYEERQIVSTVNLANWSGGLNTWHQEFRNALPVFMGTMKSESITLKETLERGDFLHVVVSLRDIGTVTLLVHEAGNVDNVYAKITCLRQNDINSIRLVSPSFGSAGAPLMEVPLPPNIPDKYGSWIRLRMQLNEGSCIIWNYDTPLGICHFKSGLSSVRAQFTIQSIKCTQVHFSGIAHIRAKYAEHIHFDMDKRNVGGHRPAEHEVEEEFSEEEE